MGRSDVGPGKFTLIPGAVNRSASDRFKAGMSRQLNSNGASGPLFGNPGGVFGVMKVSRIGDCVHNPSYPPEPYSN